MTSLCKALTKKGTNCTFKSIKNSSFCGKHQLPEDKISRLSKTLASKCSINSHKQKENLNITLQPKPNQQNLVFNSKYSLVNVSQGSKICGGCGLQIINSCPICLGKDDYLIQNIIKVLIQNYNNIIFEYKYKIRFQNKLFCYLLNVIIDNKSYLIEYDDIEKCLGEIEIIGAERSFEENQKIITQKSLLSLMQGYKMIRIPYLIEFRLEIELMKAFNETKNSLFSDIYFIDSKIYTDVINKLNLFLGD